MPTERELLSWATECLQWAEAVRDPEIKAGLHRLAAQFEAVVARAAPVPPSRLH
jgi:hypothetical protein